MSQGMRALSATSAGRSDRQLAQSRDGTREYRIVTTLPCTHIVGILYAKCAR
jgi:hypothetical protein